MAVLFLLSSHAIPISLSQSLNQQAMPSPVLGSADTGEQARSARAVLKFKGNQYSDSCCSTSNQGERVGMRWEMDRRESSQLWEGFLVEAAFAVEGRAVELGQVEYEVSG